MSDAATVDAALVSAIETLFGAGTYRQRSDVRQDRERVDPTNVAYQLNVFQLRENPQRGANQARRVFGVQVMLKKHCATLEAERTWRLGGLADGLEAMLSRAFYENAGGLGTYLDQAAPELAANPEMLGRVMVATIGLELELRAQ